MFRKSSITNLLYPARLLCPASINWSVCHLNLCQVLPYSARLNPTVRLQPLIKCDLALSWQHRTELSFWSGQQPHSLWGSISSQGAFGGRDVIDDARQARVTRVWFFFFFIKNVILQTKLAATYFANIINQTAEQIFCYCTYVDWYSLRNLNIEWQCLTLAPYICLLTSVFSTCMLVTLVFKCF